MPRVPSLVAPALVVALVSASLLLGAASSQAAPPVAPTAALTFSPGQVHVAPSADATVSVASTIDGDWGLEGTPCSATISTPCTFDVPAGPQRITVTAGGASTTAVIVVPAAPTASVGTGEGTFIDGFATHFGDSVIVQLDDGTRTTLCTTGVSETGYWGCPIPDPVPDAVTGYLVVAQDAGPCSDSPAPDCTGYVAGALSSATTTSIGPPAIGYDLTPGAITATATPTASATATSVTLSRWQWSASGTTYTTLATCPTTPDGAVFGAPGATTCTISGLTAGVYPVTASQDTGDGQTPAAMTIDHYLAVPAAPVITAAVPALDGTVALTGTGVATDGIELRIDGAPATCADGKVTVAADGTWTCRTGVLSVAGHAVTATQVDLGAGRDDRILNDDPNIRYRSGARSPVSAAAAVQVVAPAPAPTASPTPTAAPTAEPVPEPSTSSSPSPSPTPVASATPTPAPSASPAPTAAHPAASPTAWSFTVTGADLGNVHPGDAFVVAGSGMPPGATVTGELHSVVVPLGSALVASDGTFTLPVQVPADFAAGAHEIVLTMTLPDGTAAPSMQGMTVTPASAAVPAPTAIAAAPTDAGTGAAAPESASGTAAESVPSGGNILTHGLSTIAEVAAHPEKVAAALEIGLALLLFAALPSHLLNSVLGDQYEKLRRAYESGRRRAPGWWRRIRDSSTRHPVATALLLIAVTAFVLGFADPAFGPTVASLRLFLAAAIAATLIGYVIKVVVGRIMRARWGVEVEISIRPPALLLTVAAVVISRLLEFSPGFLVGIVLGLVIAEKAAKEHAWKAVALDTGLRLGLAIAAWSAFSLFDTSTEGGSFATALTIETLVAITTEAVVSLLVELLPLRNLAGAVLFARSKLLWGAAYLLAVVVFVVAVIPWEGNWATLGGSLGGWIAAVVGFGVLATGVYVVVRIRDREEPEQIAPDELIPISEEPADAGR